MLTIQFQKFIKFCAKILNKENKKKKIKFITISAGIIKVKWEKKLNNLLV